MPIQITDPNLNPRFVLGLIREVESAPSPYLMQLRLKLAGMRPINNIVDATNYAMLEIGEPLHAFDYDVLVERAGGKAPTIITRTAKPGEKLTTLDGVERKLDPFTIMVTDTAGALSLAGMMGGAESEISEKHSQHLAGRGCLEFYQHPQNNHRPTTEFRSRLPLRPWHPSRPGNGRRPARFGAYGRWGGGQIAAGLVDAYPKPPSTRWSACDRRMSGAIWASIYPL